MRLLFWLGIVLSVGVAIAAAKTPLADVHWDTPFYLYKAKTLVEAPIYSGYVTHADRIAKEVMEGTWDKSLSYIPQSYWYFSKLGHLTTLGGFVAVGESGWESLVLAHWGYSLLLALSVGLLIILTLQLDALFSIKTADVITGAGLSALLFMASGQYWHMTGNLVAEVPALFFVAVAVTSLTGCQLRRSWALAVLAGLATFMAYATRADFLWVVLTLGGLFSAGSRIGLPRKAWYPGLVLAGLIALVSYVTFAWVYRPLANPLVFFRFWDIVQHSVGNEFGSFRLRLARMLIIAGGLLWVGALLALPMLKRQLLARIALVWLLLLGLPWIWQVVWGGWGEARMLTSLLPGIFLLSTAGWSGLLARFYRTERGVWEVGAIAAAVLLMLIVTHQATYDAIRRIPGGWRMQYVRAILRPDQYEQRTYPVSDLRAISDALYVDGDPKLVVLGPGANHNLEYVNVIRFLGPRLPPGTDLFSPEPQKAWRTGIEPGVGPERVAFRTYVTEGDGEPADVRGYRLYVLSRERGAGSVEHEGWCFAVRQVVRGSTYELGEVTQAFRGQCQ